MRFTIPLVLLTFVATTAASLYARNGVDDTNIFNRAVSRHGARQLPASIPADCQKYCTPVSNATRTVSLEKVPECQILTYAKKTHSEL